MAELYVDNDDKYFATEGPEELGPKLVEKVGQYRYDTGVQQIDGRMWHAWRYYYGYDPMGFHATANVARGGVQGELAEIRINHSRSLVQTLLNLIVAPQFVWNPRAATMDYDAVRQVEAARAILEHYWHGRNFSTYATKAVESAISLSEGFIHEEWDPALGDEYSVDPENPANIVKTGDIRITNVAPWDVIRDPFKPSFDECDWVIVRQFRNKWNLAVQYPEKATEIRQVPTEVPVRGDAGYSLKVATDDVPVYLFYHKPCASLPLGRMTKFVSSGDVLEDGILPYGTIPLQRVTCAELQGTPYGYTPYFEILGIQEVMDSINSSLATNITTFGTQSIAIEEGAPVHPDDLGGGMKIIYYRPGSQPPQPLQLTKSPPEAFKYLDDLKMHEELLMGLNNVVRGQMQTGKESGAALALLQSQAIQQASVLQRNYLNALMAAGTAILRIIRTQATMPMKIGIMGKGRLDLIRETEIDRTTVSQIDQVVVELGNPVSQTAAGRFELAMQLVQMQVVKTPAEVLEVLETGRLEPVVKGTQEELVNIMKENQDMVRGETPVVLLSDDHPLHGKEHTAAVASPAARRDPNVLRAYREHMHDHYSQFYGIPLEMVETDPLYRQRFLMLCGRPVPPEPAPPMPPPGSPGPGPGPGGPPPEAAIPGAAEGPSAQAVTGPTLAGTAKMPSMPTNPATGQEWNPINGGGAVPTP
jgi:hypothetical protein